MSRLSNDAGGHEGGSERERRKALTQRAILEAARDVFAQQGFEGATLREVAERAGVKQPLLVYHFQSKEVLWKATIDLLWTRVVAAVRAGSDWAEIADSPQVVRAVLRSFIQIVADEPAWLQILLREASQPGPRLDWLVEQHSRATYAAGMEFLESAQKLGLVPKLPTRHLLYILTGALTFVMAIAPEVERVTGEDPRSAAFLDRHVDTFIALLFPELARGRDPH